MPIYELIYHAYCFRSIMRCCRNNSKVYYNVVEINQCLAKAQ